MTGPVPDLASVRIHLLADTVMKAAQAVTASGYREYALTCDRLGPACLARFGPLHRATSRAALRKLAAKQGWTRRHGNGGRKYGEGFCPAHKPAGEG